MTAVVIDAEVVSGGLLGSVAFDVRVLEVIVSVVSIGSVSFVTGDSVLVAFVVERGGLTGSVSFVVGD